MSSSLATELGLHPKAIMTLSSRFCLRSSSDLLVSNFSSSVLITYLVGSVLVLLLLMLLPLPKYLSSLSGYLVFLTEVAALRLLLEIETNLVPVTNTLSKTPLAMLGCET